jgi:ABC-type Fe3+-hydroxamate transport system substrate-binding protein
MHTITDQIGNEIRYESIPTRIISTVPSITELLHYLDLDVLGITKFCIHPKSWHESKIKVGGTKNLNIERILALNPELIIANKEENTQEAIEALQKHTSVYVSDIHNISEAYEFMKAMGRLFGKDLNPLIQSIQDGMPIITHRKSACYLIWKDPWMAAGGHTYIDDMLAHAGFENVVTQYRYPMINISDIQAEYFLLSSEPYPFQEKHIAELQELHPSSKVIIVDGESFSWYGSRMLFATKYFTELYKLCHA